MQTRFKVRANPEAEFVQVRADVAAGEIAVAVVFVFVFRSCLFLALH